ncbi:hypothetical protein JCM30760_26460 [Thiomicrorhabdus hydrogeniphila]
MSKNKFFVVTEESGVSSLTLDTDTDNVQKLNQLNDISHINPVLNEPDAIGAALYILSETQIPVLLVVQSVHDDIDYITVYPSLYFALKALISEFESTATSYGLEDCEIERIVDSIEKRGFKTVEEYNSSEISQIVWDTGCHLSLQALSVGD